jgi:hypothetical protein
MIRAESFSGISRRTAGTCASASGDQTLTAVITRDAVEELKLRRGDEALAIVKSTEVMIAREVDAAASGDRVPPPRPGRRR